MSQLLFLFRSGLCSQVNDPPQLSFELLTRVCSQNDPPQLLLSHASAFSIIALAGEKAATAPARGSECAYAHRRTIHHSACVGICPFGGLARRWKTRRSSCMRMGEQRCMSYCKSVERIEGESTREGEGSEISTGGPLSSVGKRESRRQEKDRRKVTEGKVKQRMRR